MTNQYKKPAIWTISFWYPPNFTGRGIQAHREHREFVKQGMSVTVLTSGISAAKSQRGKLVNMDGVMVRYLPVLPMQPWSFASRFRLLYKILFSIYANLSSLSFALWCAWILLRHGQYNDMVRFEAYNRFAIMPMAITGLKGLHPISRMSLVGSDDPYSALKMARHGQILEYLTLAPFHTAEVVVAICSAMIESCQKAKISGEKVLYLPHGVDTELYRPVDETGKAKIRQKLGLSLHKRHILFVGSAIERKGIDVLIDSFIHLRRKMDNVDLLIVGPVRFDQRTYDNAAALQNTVNECKDKLAAAQCSDFVHWIGEVDNVNEYMKVADVFCLPTRQEGFGIVIIEAMASGLPVVISQLEGVTTDIISSAQEGLLIPGLQFKDYAEAMIEVLNHPQKAKQMGLAARSRAVSVFSLEYAVHQWVCLFQKLMQD